MTALAMVAALTALVTGSSSAAPPSGPGYQCSSAAPATGALKIMLAGDSITNASAGDYTWRYWLWRDLVDRGAKVNFVGSFDDTLVGTTLVYGNHQYLDCNFDQDHEARGGVKFYNANTNKPSYTRPFTSSDPFKPNYPGYSSWIRGAVNTHKPSVIVAFVGTNDVALPTTPAGSSETQVADKAIGFLKTFINEARRGNPGVDIVLTTVPEFPDNARFKIYNSKLAGVVKQKSTASSRLVIAKLPSWANHTYDGLHPDAVGEVGIAAAVNAALHTLVPSLPGRPSVLQKPKLGPRVPAVLSGQANGNNKVDLSWVLPPGSERTIVYSRNVTGNGPWVKHADLVWTKMRTYYPNLGTQTCDTPCTSFTVSGLSGGTKYAFRVRSGKGLALAPDIFSNVIGVTATGPLGKVESVTVTPGVRSATVAWPALGGANGYDLQVRADGTSSWTTVSNATSPRTVTGLVGGQKYFFRVRAKGSALIILPAPGPWSDEVAATPKSN